tara:strand:+ start:199 stop:423 length:225 start_codon:yes stop_codon:yes gene_type:complete
MKNLIILFSAALLFSCNSQNETKKTSEGADQKFLTNCTTVQGYLDDFVNESIDIKNILMIPAKSEEHILIQRVQ